MKTEHWTGETPCKINGFRNFEFLIFIANALGTDANSLLADVLDASCPEESAFFAEVSDKYQELSKRQQEKVLRLMNALITEELHEN